MSIESLITKNEQICRAVVVTIRETKIAISAANGPQFVSVNCAVMPNVCS